MKQSKQNLVENSAAPPTEAAISAEKSPLHSMMVQDANGSDGVPKVTANRGSRGLKRQIAISVAIVVMAAGLLALSLTLWTGSGAKNSTPKTAWPELVGEPGLDAQETILQENSDITVAPLVGLDSMVTQDYRTDRVWIYVNDDDDQTVARTPTVG